MHATDAPLRLLVVVAEPPPCSSGLGLAWAKLATGLHRHGVQLEFMGPPPDTAYGRVTRSRDHGPRLHPFEQVPLSRRVSVLRNQRSGLAWLWWSFVRGSCVLRERFFKVKDPYLDWMCAEATRLLPRVVGEGSFDAVLVHMPPLELGLAVARACKTGHVPLMVVIGDPLGGRLPAGVFVPASSEEQFAMIHQSVGVLSAEATREICYRSVMEIDSEKWIPLSDCMANLPQQRGAPVALRNIMHWGTVAPWRPIHALVDALLAEAPPVGESPLGLQVVGAIVDADMRRYVRERMQARVVEHPLMPIEEALTLAAGADAFVVVVSPRHLDNTPSRLIELLQFSRPILLLAPAGSASAQLVEELGIGPIADPTDSMKVLQAIGDLRRRYHEYVAAYAQTERFRRVSCDEVTRVMAEGFRRVLSAPQQGTDSSGNSHA